MSVTAPIFEFS